VWSIVLAGVRRPANSGLPAGGAGLDGSRRRARGCRRCTDLGAGRRAPGKAVAVVRIAQPAAGSHRL